MATTGEEVMADLRTPERRTLNDHPVVVAVAVLASVATILTFVAADPFGWRSPGGSSGSSSTSTGTGPNRETPPPETTAPPTTAAPPAAAPGLPAAFVGHWQGEGQSDADSYLRFTIALDLRDGHVGSTVGSARFDGNFHTGSFGAPAQYGLRLVALTTDGVQVAEQGGFDDVVLLLDGRTITYHARNRGEPLYWVTATLSRIA
jgi:hypothetical protein